jgi:hypothetical protein
MAARGKKMKRIEDDIRRIDAEIAGLQREKAALLRALNYINDGPEASAAPAQSRKRSPNIKPLILDYMKSLEWIGATSVEVSAVVKDRVPTVAKDTVGSVLSRLKADGALVYDGERYYDVRFAPKSNARPFEPRAVA